MKISRAATVCRTVFQDEWSSGDELVEPPGQANPGYLGAHRMYGFFIQFAVIAHDSATSLKCVLSARFPSPAACGF